MTIQEFKAWLDGFMDSAGGVDVTPTALQWAKIRVRLDQLSAYQVDPNSYPLSPTPISYLNPLYTKTSLDFSIPKGFS